MFVMTLLFRYLLFSYLTLMTIYTSNVYAQQKYTIYLDADFSGATASSLAIQQGITTALAEVDNQIQGIEFGVILKDHRANSLRSRRNLEAFLADEQALMVFSGLHSPPLLANKSFINDNDILLLDPWAAAGPITRSGSDKNWIFRLSIDDSNAGLFISRKAIEQGFSKPYLLLEDTGWGRSNEKTMTEALNESSIKPKGLSWFNWGVGMNHAKVLLRDIKASGADVIFFVGNSAEGVTFAKAMVDLPQSIRLPIRSHWGITGGDFTDNVPASQRENIDLQFIQTNFSFINDNLSALAKNVLALAVKSNSNIKHPADIKAQTGFIHAYDLTKIVITAIKQVKLTGDRNQDKSLVHHALEHLVQPVPGLLKRYQRPFSPYNKKQLNAHEALTIEDYAMGKYTLKDEIVLLNSLGDNH
ncbi:ABC transporter substrate-binding protein [Colwellia demingiae]|uniref:ABC transporter substrate-binding protein n=2 Tax=Colwellia demingiae TaxID=89401 RepID=A0A5C6QFQ0_9GAMM|nr:ABC transporter substrate-binding protein [Colwellia demingiae]